MDFNRFWERNQIDFMIQYHRDFKHKHLACCPELFICLLSVQQSLLFCLSIICLSCLLSHCFCCLLSNCFSCFGTYNLAVFSAILLVSCCLFYCLAAIFALVHTILLSCLLSCCLFYCLSCLLSNGLFCFPAFVLSCLLASFLCLMLAWISIKFAKKVYMLAHARFWSLVVRKP